MFDIIEKTEKNVLSAKITGKLTEEDYKQMYPLIEETVDKYGKVKLYVELDGFEGWDNLKAFWEETKMDIRYFNDLEKAAVVGDKKWEALITKAGDLLNPAKIRYFPIERKEEAKSWLYQ